MLHNSVNVMKKQRVELGLPEYPFFTHREIEACERQWMSRSCGRPFQLAPGTEIEATFFPAGHILGAAGVQLTVSGKTIFYTGDVNFEDLAISKGADFPEETIDILILEATRGDSERPAAYSREEEAGRFAGFVERCLSRGGTVMIPVFAMGKTQEMLMTCMSCRAGGDPPGPGANRRSQHEDDPLVRSLRRDIPAETCRIPIPVGHAIAPVAATPEARPEQ